jgi:hypothetical protein
MNGISDAQWAVYANIINKAHDFFNQDIITWVRKSHGLQRWGEDNKGIRKDDTIDLKCLINYNVFRAWPMSKETDSGVIDKESILIVLNKKYLNGLGYINANGNFDFDPGEDYFIHQGQKLRSSGETPASQAKSDPLHVFIILKRMETLTGSKKY